MHGGERVPSVGVVCGVVGALSALVGAVDLLTQNELKTRRHRNADSAVKCLLPGLLRILST